MDAPISLGLLIVAVVGWIRDLRVRLAEVIGERNSARIESEFWEGNFYFMRRGYDLLASMYRTATRHQGDAEPLPFDPQDFHNITPPTGKEPRV